MLENLEQATIRYVALGELYVFNYSYYAQREEDAGYEYRQGYVACLIPDAVYAPVIERTLFGTAWEGPELVRKLLLDSSYPYVHAPSLVGALQELDKLVATHLPEFDSRWMRDCLDAIQELKQADKERRKK